MNSGWILVCALVAMSLATVHAWAIKPTDEERAAARKWIAAYFGLQARTQPFSFVYGNRPSADLLPTWKVDRVSRRLDRNRTEHTLTWTDPATGLALRCVAVEYRDFPTVEWTLTLKNTGPADTPIIENIQALDIRFERGASGEFLLRHNVGSPANRSDYGPLETPLGPNAAKRISAAGGRPTNSDMSYFNLAWGGEGMIVVVGWPGQWAAEFSRDAAAGIHVRAGQELTHFTLRPGEEARTPLIVLQAWKGDWIRGQNLWRRWMMAHGMPHPGGKLPPPQMVASSSRAYEEMKGANEANQIMHIDRYLEEGLKLDYWWMDAGWYVQQTGWPQTGTWEVDKTRFPKGFKPISNHAHARGVKILVWFEPERVAPGTWLAEEHPEWLLSTHPGRAGQMAGMVSCRSSELGGPDPNVSCNQSNRTITMAGIHWDPGRLSFHPGPKGEYSVVRWTAPAPGEYRLTAAFIGIDEKTTTDVHVRHGVQSFFDGFINLQGQGRHTEVVQTIAVKAGDVLDFVVGWGNGSYVSDSTGLEATLIGPDGSIHDAAKAFSVERNPNREWSYGYLAPGATPDSSTFRLYDRQGKADDGETHLLNLGDPDAWNWLVNHIDKLLTENGIDLYRQDFNIDPLAFWRANDAEDRQGITEIKYVTGYLAYWDELRRRHSNMLIDSCASGGRRNDLETMRRAVPLWRSDYAFEAIGHQCMTYGISMWLPYHGTGTVATANAPYYGGGYTPVEPYAFWSNAAPSLGSGIDVRVKEIDYAALRKLFGAWRRMSRFYYGDYYPLTPYSQEENVWIAWQFDRPEKGDGAVQAFRRAKCPEDTVLLKLRGLDPEASYTITDIDGRGARKLTGRELMESGLPVTVKELPGAMVIAYKKSR
jgi:alpha-galactosidase